MKNLLHIIITLLFLSIIAGCSPYYKKNIDITAIEKLTGQINKQIDEPELETAFLAIFIQSVQTGEIIYQHNSKKLMMPASNEKIPTSAAALIKLGPNFQYETQIYYTGSISDSVLNGDLIIVGSGDPTIGYRLCQEDDTCDFFISWANALKKAGIYKINGNLIGIDDIFDDQAIGYGWTVNNLSYYYAAQICGLTLHENSAKITISADSSTNQISLDIFPDYDYLTIISKVNVTTDKKEATDIWFERVEGTNDIIITGTMLAGTSESQDVSVHNPALYFLTGLQHELKKADIPITGTIMDSDDLSDSLTIEKNHLIHTHLSPPFSEILTILMKESNNLYAESFIKLLGARFGKEGTFAEGEKILKHTLRRFGLEKDSYLFMDGSGLCRYNYISPYQIVKILRGMYYHPYGSIFRQSLPVAGTDGTIGYRLKGTNARNKILAKTGTISNVRCLSGYATTLDDEVLAFSIMANNFICDVNVIMDLQDRICMLLTSFSRK